MVLIAPTRDTSVWVKGLKAIDPELEIYTHPEVPEEAKAGIRCAVTWLHPKGSLGEFPNLELVCSMGAGVDHLIDDPDIAPETPMTRIVDPALAWSMSNFCLTALLNYHRQWQHFVEQQADKRWAQKDECELELRVGVLGLGFLGQDLAQKVAQLGFYVAGYSQSPKEVDGVESFAGPDQLDDFLGKVNALVCLLPLTDDTESFLNKAFFARCQPGTYLINVARGSHLVEDDLIPALEAGHLSGAVLDVFRKEPLPADHPFWSDSRITVTPHHASLTNPQAAIPQIMENYQRMVQGEPLKNEVDKGKGY